MAARRWSSPAPVRADMLTMSSPWGRISPTNLSHLLNDQLYREAKVEQVEYADAILVTAVCTPKTLGRVGEYVVAPPGWR